MPEVSPAAWFWLGVAQLAHGQVRPGYSCIVFSVLCSVSRVKSNRHVITVIDVPTASQHLLAVCSVQSCNGICAPSLLQSLLALVQPGAQDALTQASLRRSALQHMAAAARCAGFVNKVSAGKVTCH